MARSLANILINRYKDYEKKEARVGWFPSSQYPEEDGGEYVAMVAVTQEFGDPSKHIPPRPFLRPTIKDESKKWAKIVGQSIRQQMSGDDVLELVGLQMQGDIKEAIGEVTTPALAPLTIKLRQERGNFDTHPLNDTGYMIATLINTVEEK
jgi:hypothetical protein